MRRLHFRLPDLPRVREFAACGALELGMRKEAVDDFVIAVNEVATNAVTHGDDAAHVRLWSEAGEIVIEVHDDGTWKPGPQPGSVGGMGLWVARLLASDLTLRVGSGGSTVIMRFPGKADV
ncbi:ATP-binding protein [Nonomuraea sp. CA-218870]|uniref:ATP-binding protein n=1 Tax=Nonomuraea sp. CA-218870 TaxID=3239998 RepID=UPI003D937AEC